MHTQSTISNLAPRFPVSQNVARTMSSREIAELTGSTHDNVLKTIRALVERGVVSGNETPYTHPQNGQVYAEFLLTYRDTMVVVSGYSVELRAKIIDRWQELEAQVVQRIPQTRAEALRLAADLEEQNEALTAQIEQQKPAVEFVDRYVDSTGALGFREVCKLLSANESTFRKFLIDKRVMYVLAGSLTPHGPHLAAGRFQVRAGVNEQNQHAYTQAKFTPKGVQWIAGMWMREQMEAREQ
ncbi:phage antirepressor KilAC domain-containing protein [Metapseudomonas furukawaii]|uniref:phage antirepressor KilAC domain-containing protein n=1 Tax=Metapseudomonas furukawaii TaxID=1149133 RepID=UPI0040461533